MSAANSQPPHIEDDEAELLALRAALAEAEAGGPSIPHEAVEAEMQVTLDRLVLKAAKPNGE